MASHRGPTDPNERDEFAQFVKNILHTELSSFLDDIEFRVLQSREHEQQAERLLAAARAGGDSGGLALVPDLGRRVYAEDLNLGRHQITGYTVTANSPTAGSIAWASVHVVYNGVDYTAANANTAMKYVWFIKPATGTTVTLSTGNTKPVLGPADCLIFVNNGGTPVSALETSIPAVLADGAVGSGELADGAVTPTKTTFYSDLAGAVLAAQNAADLAQATADGSITTYFQSAAPWANGTVQPAAKVGDIWYDSDNGQAFRWSGAAGTPANTWVMIEDSNIGAALAAAQAAQTTANSKITTFYAASTAVPTALAIGDLWVVTNMGNLTRRASAVGTGSWVDLPVGTQGLADGAVTDVKVGTGISGTKLASGTVGNTQLGTGIDGAKLSTGTVTGTQLGAGSVTPVKLNTLQHILY